MAYTNPSQEKAYVISQYDLYVRPVGMLVLVKYIRIDQTNGALQNPLLAV